jgi:NAD(P)-dependent dehydrogenase (short-subunit alcohol dehydrogenase family)
LDELTTQDNLQLVGQVAAVTGGGRGIGRVIACQAISGVKNLHRANKIEFVDRRNDDHGDTAPFEKAFARDVLP